MFRTVPTESRMNTALVQMVATSNSPNGPAMAPADGDMRAVSESGTFHQALSDSVQPETGDAASGIAGPAESPARSEGPPADADRDAGRDAEREGPAPAAADCEGAQVAPSAEKGNAPAELSAAGAPSAAEDGSDEELTCAGEKANATAGCEEGPTGGQVQIALAGEKMLATVATAAAAETETAPAAEKDDAPAAEKDDAAAATVADGKDGKRVAGKAGVKSLPADVIPARRPRAEGEAQPPEKPGTVRPSGNESEAGGEAARPDEKQGTADERKPGAVKEKPRAPLTPSQKTRVAATAGAVSGTRKAAPKVVSATARPTATAAATAADAVSSAKPARSAADKDSSGDARGADNPHNVHKARNARNTRDARNVRQVAPQRATAGRKNDVEVQEAADTDARSGQAQRPERGDAAGKVTRIDQATTASRGAAPAGGRVSGRPQATLATTFASQVQDATASESAPRAGGNAAASPPGTRAVMAQMEQVAFVQRVVRQARLVSQGRGAQEIRVELRPPELGSVRLTLSLENDQLQARVQVESNAAQEALERMAPRLRETLAGDGLELEKFDVDLRNSGGRQDRPDAHGTRGGGGQGPGRGFARAEEPQLAGAHLWRRPVAAGRMDYTA